MKAYQWPKYILLVLPLLFVASCSFAPQGRESVERPDSHARVPSSEQLTRNVERLEAAIDARRQHSQSRAHALLATVDTTGLSTNERMTYDLLNAQLAIDARQPARANKWLQSVDVDQLTSAQMFTYRVTHAELAELEGLHAEAVTQWGRVMEQSHAGRLPLVYDRLWSTLLACDRQDVEKLLNSTSNEKLRPWLELALIYRMPHLPDRQLQLLERWEQRWADTPAPRYLPHAVATLRTVQAYKPNIIAVLLPLSGPQQALGEAVRDGLLSGYYRDLRSGSGEVDVRLYDTHAQAPGPLALQAQQEGAELIVGPLGRSAANAVAKQPGIDVPLFVLNSVNVPMASEQRPLYQFSLASEFEAKQAAQRAWQDGYRHPLVINSADSWGRRVAKAFMDAWRQQGGRVLAQHAYTGHGDFNAVASRALSIDDSVDRASIVSRSLGQRVDYTPRRREDADMIFIIGTPEQGRQLKPALDFYFAGDLAIYTVSRMFSGRADSSLDRDLNGIRIPLMPWISSRSASLRGAINRAWPKESVGPLAPFYALGVDAWQLYPRLGQMAAAPESPVFGVTGTLSLQADGIVERKLAWHFFKGGELLPLRRKKTDNTEAQ